MRAFSNYIKKQNEDIKEEIKEKNSPWYYIKQLFDIIDDYTNTHTNINDKLNTLFNNIADSEYYFLAWALNHYLIYNKFTRTNIEMFTYTFYNLKAKDYIYWYVYFMNKNKVKFPKFLPWYKLDIEGKSDKKYIDIVKEQFDLSDEEIETLISYYNNKGLSLKEICLNINYI